MAFSKPVNNKYVIRTDIGAHLAKDPTLPAIPRAMVSALLGFGCVFGVNGMRAPLSIDPKTQALLGKAFDVVWGPRKEEY